MSFVRSLTRPLSTRARRQYRNMSYKLLLGGYRDTVALVSFEPTSSVLKVISENPAPKNTAWIEPSVQKPNVFYSLSEVDDGQAFGLEVDGETVKPTRQRATNGGPAHIASLKDGSGIVVANYGGGSAIYLPIDASDAELTSQSASPNLVFPYPYEGKTAPNPDRQEASHPHQVVEGADGTLYVPDLGSDKIWLVKRDGDSGLKVDGFLQAPEGSGPRHLVFSKDGKYLYCVAELGHNVIAWDLSSGSQTILPDFSAKIIPPWVPDTHSKFMDSSEIAINPLYPNTLYVANRLELSIFKKQPELSPLPNYPPPGDAVSIFILSEDGSKVKDIKYIQTESDNLRGLTVSPDGKYVAVAGQDGGGVQVYSIGGANGEQWNLVAKDNSLEKVNTLVWV